MHLDKMIGTSTYHGIIRSYVDEPSADASDWTDEELLDYINMEHRHLFAKIRNLYEDWFMRVLVFPTVLAQYRYVLPRECVNVRRVEYLSASGVSGTSPNYVVDEEKANPEEVQEVEISGKDNLRHYTSSNRVVRTNGYNLYDDELVFLKDSRLDGTQYYVRVFYLPTAPDLHRGEATSGAASTITLALNSATTTLGRVSNVENFYQGMYVEIISGTGEGQIRRIKTYAGSTRIATIEPNWTTNPAGDSRYSIVSPIKEDYHELLALGAVMRAKGIKIEDPSDVVAQMYGVLTTEMVASLERRNHQVPRRVMTTQRSGVWF